MTGSRRLNARNGLTTISWKSPIRRRSENHRIEVRQTTRRIIVGAIGGDLDATGIADARQFGREVAMAGCILLTGGVPSRDYEPNGESEPAAQDEDGMRRNDRFSAQVKNATMLGAVESAVACRVKHDTATPPAGWYRRGVRSRTCRMVKSWQAPAARSYSECSLLRLGRDRSGPVTGRGFGVGVANPSVRCGRS